MNKVDWKDVVDRGAWTFAQTFLAVVVASGTGFVSTSVVETAALAAGAAVLSFLKNVAFGVTGDVPPDPGQ